MKPPGTWHCSKGGHDTHISATEAQPQQCWKCDGFVFFAKEHEVTHYARCRCAECERLDRLPVKLHGIPHAWQPNMLNAMQIIDWPEVEPYHPQGPSRAAIDHSTLPLFAASDQGRLF